MFVIGISSQTNIDGKLILDTRAANNKRPRDVREVTAHFGPFWCKAIVGFHIFAGRQTLWHI